MNTLNSCCECDIDAVINEEGNVCGLCDLVQLFGDTYLLACVTGLVTQLYNSGTFGS